MKSITKLWRFGSISVVFITLLLSSAANARTNYYYAEMLSSDFMGSAQDTRFEVLAQMTKHGNLDSMLINSQTKGEGLGDAFILSGESFSYDHTFTAIDMATHITSASVSVLTYSGQENAASFIEIALDDNFWLEQSTSFRIAGGHIDAGLFEDDGAFMVSISAHGDNVKLLSSMFEVRFQSHGRSGGVSAAIPEPGAGMLFAAGVLIVGTSIRRRAPIA